MAYHNQYARTDGLIDIPIKVIINNILILFTIISNTNMTDVLIKEILIDSPLLIIKEHINYGNFLNKDRFNFLTNKVNYKSLIDFPQTIIVIDKRLYGEALFHIFSQSETYSKTYKTERIMADFVKFLNSRHSDIDRLCQDYSYTTTQRLHKSVEKKSLFYHICSTF